jgi:hypothetical protein
MIPTISRVGARRNCTGGLVDQSSLIEGYARLELALILFGRQTPHHIGIYPMCPIDTLPARFPVPFPKKTSLASDLDYRFFLLYL